MTYSTLEQLRKFIRWTKSGTNAKFKMIRRTPKNPPESTAVSYTRQNNPFCSRKQRWAVRMHHSESIIIQQRQPAKCRLRFQTGLLTGNGSKKVPSEKMEKWRLAKCLHCGTRQPSLISPFPHSPIRGKKNLLCIPARGSRHSRAVKGREAPAYGISPQNSWAYIPSRPLWWL